MTEYKYRACSAEGKVRHGKFEAENEEELKRYLASDGLRALEIKKQGLFAKDIKIFKHHHASPKKLAHFCREFSAIYSAGVPMVTALELLRNQTSDQRMKNAIHRIVISVESGSGLADSMRKETSVFPKMLSEMVGVGEKAGTLPAALDRMAEYYEKSSRTRSSAGKAMIYPAIVSVVVFAVLIVLTTKVIPRFEAIFNASGSELPWITKGLMSFCGFVASNLPFILIFILAAIVSMFAFSKTEKGRYVFGYVVRKIPLVKTFTEKNASAMFSRTISLLLSSGIPILDAMDITALNLKNIYFRDAVLNTKKGIMQGSPLSSSLYESGVFPPMIVQMTSIGENSGNLSDMLEKCADYYDEETENASQAMLAALEPVLMVFLIVIVAVIVFAIALPMFSLYSNILKQ